MRDGLFPHGLRTKSTTDLRYYQRFDGMLAIVDLHIAKWNRESTVTHPKLPFDLESIVKMFQRKEINKFHVEKHLQDNKFKITLNGQYYQEAVRKTPIQPQCAESMSVGRFFDLST